MTEILAMEKRRDILKILLFVTRPKSTKEIHSPSATVQMFPGRRMFHYTHMLQLLLTELKLTLTPSSTWKSRPVWDPSASLSVVVVRFQTMFEEQYETISDAPTSTSSRRRSHGKPKTSLDTSKRLPALQLRLSRIIAGVRSSSEPIFLFAFATF